MKNILVIIIVAYLFMNFFMSSMAALVRSSNSQKIIETCAEPQSRIGVIFWGLRLGCWLGEPYE